MTSAAPRSDAPAARAIADRKLAYSVGEAAALLGISRTSAYLAAQRGDLPSRLIGRRRVIPVAALNAYLARLNSPNSAQGHVDARSPDPMTNGGRQRVLMGQGAGLP